jgi:hypothetical protein
VPPAAAEPPVPPVSAGVVELPLPAQPPAMTTAANIVTIELFTFMRRT